jgi:hypothetical protein
MFKKIYFFFKENGMEVFSSIAIFVDEIFSEVLYRTKILYYSDIASIGESIVL